MSSARAAWSLARVATGTFVIVAGKMVSAAVATRNNKRKTKMMRQKTIFNENRPRPLPERPSAGSLRFSPTAWAKLLFLRDIGDSEVGGFGITAADDPLFIENVQLVG